MPMGTVGQCAFIVHFFDPHRPASVHLLCIGWPQCVFIVHQCVFIVHFKPWGPWGGSIRTWGSWVYAHPEHPWVEKEGAGAPLVNPLVSR